MRLANDTLVVDFDEAAGGPASVRDRRTGKEWTPAATPFVVVCWDRMAERRVFSAAGYDSAATLDVTRVGDSAVRVLYSQRELGLKMELTYRLHDDYLEVAIPVSSIEEDGLRRFRLLSLELLPSFGAACRGEQGYLALPHHGGVLHYFDRENTGDAERGAADPKTEFAVQSLLAPDPGAAREHGSMIYGEQGQWEDMIGLPIFGAVHERSGYLAIVTSGEFDTEIMVRVNQGERKQASVHPVLHFRHHEQDGIDPVDRCIRYCFLSNDSANYASTAGIYRRYLLDEKGCTPVRERVKENELLEYFRQCYHLKLYFGRKDSTPDGTGELRQYLSYGEAKELLGELQEAGVDRANLILTGWNREGHDGLYPTVFPIETAFGSEQELDDLIAEAKRLGYRITVHINYREAYRRSPDWRPEYILRDRFGRLVKQGVYGGGQAWQMCPATVLDPLMKRDLPKLKAMGLNGPLYFDGILATMQSCHDENHPLSRRQFCQAAKDYLRYARELFQGVHTEVATADMIGATDHVMHLPAYKWAKAKWISDAPFYQKEIAHEGIPLQAMVYHGLTLYCLQGQLQNTLTPGAYILSCIEYGALPRDTWYNNEPRRRIADQARQYEVLCKTLGQVFETVYSNGQRTIVNYSDRDYESDGCRVGAGSYVLA